MDVRDIAMIKALSGKGGSGSCNYSGEPFGAEKTEMVYGDTLTWDGNIDGLYGVDFFKEGGNSHFLVSNVVPTLNDISNGGTFEMSDGELYNFTLDNVWQLSANTFMIYDFIIIVGEPDAGVDLGGIVFNKAGIYFVSRKLWGDDLYVKSLTINGYNDFLAEKTTIEKLKPKYLPDAVLLYFDNTYIYESKECSRGGELEPISKAKLKKLILSGRKILLCPGDENVTYSNHIAPFGYFLPIHIDEYDTSWLTVYIYKYNSAYSDTFYTAEYTDDGGGGPV